jgi:hypothetical protein
MIAAHRNWSLSSAVRGILLAWSLAAGSTSQRSLDEGRTTGDFPRPCRSSHAETGQIERWTFVALPYCIVVIVNFRSFEIRTAAAVGGSRGSV